MVGPRAFRLGATYEILKHSSRSHENGAPSAGAPFLLSYHSDGGKPAKPPPPQRTEPREIIELRQLKEDQPDLAQAIDLQIQLLQLQRRVQSRVPLPTDEPRRRAPREGAARRGKPILTFDQVPIDWSDLRFLVRSTADAMRTHEAIETEDYRRVEALSRDADRLPPAMRDWYEAARPIVAGGREVPEEIAGLESLLPAGDAAVPLALRRRGHGEDDVPGLAARQLSAVRRRARLLDHHALQPTAC